MKKIKLIWADKDGTKIPLWKIPLGDTGEMKVLLNVSLVDTPEFKGLQITLLNGLLLIGQEIETQDAPPGAS